MQELIKKNMAENTGYFSHIYRKPLAFFCIPFYNRNMRLTRLAQPIATEAFPPDDLIFDEDAGGPSDR